MTDDNNILIRKLNLFIRKYYKNRMIRGILVSVGVMVLYFIVLIGLEYFLNLNSISRSILFYSFILLSAFLFVRMVCIPALQVMNIGKRLTPEQAADIIGKHFSNIQDKLLNAIQLIQLTDESKEQSELLSASILQKTKELKVFEFEKVIDKRRTRKIMQYALIPVLIVAAFLILSPATISEPTKRIVRYDEEFQRALPFTLEILNKSLVGVQQQDFELSLRATGQEIPLEVLISYGGIDYKMKKSKGFRYSYTFRSLQKDIRFTLKADGYETGSFEIKVFPKPIILSFVQRIEFPAYINRADELLENQGDCSVPEGSLLKWELFTKDVSEIKWRIDDEPVNLGKPSGNVFRYETRATKSFSYSFTPLNANTFLADSLRYKVMVINDGYPSVYVAETTDSLTNNRIFFRGTLKDDYGFSKLAFKYSNSSDSADIGQNYRELEIPVDKKVNNQVFYYAIDIDQLEEAGSEVRYYFEVWDNDGIHGPKSAKTEQRIYKKPTLAELRDQSSKNNQDINDMLEKGVGNSQSLQKGIDDIQKRMIDQKELDWKDRKKIDDLVKKSEELEKNLNGIRSKLTQNINTESKYLNTGERIVEKQKEINELLEQLLNEDVKKQIKELKDLLNTIDKEKVSDLIDKLKMDSKKLEKELDKNLALLKQLAFEKNFEEKIKELRENSENLKKLSEETLDHKQVTEDLKMKLSEATKKNDSLQMQLKKLEEESKELETPVDFGNSQKKQDSINKALSEAGKELNKQNRPGSSKSQKEAGKQMSELADQMEQAMNDSEEDQLGEDARTVRILLENILRLSFEQEELIGQTRVINRMDPRFTENIVKQKEFSGQIAIIEDSLRVIARRQIMVRPVITREIELIKSNQQMTLEAMEARNTGLATAKQQFVMTSLNNLAVLLDEALKKMDEQLSQSQSSKSGSKACKKPGNKGGKSKAKGLKDMQKSLGEQLQQLKKDMEGNSSAKGNSEKKGMLSKEIAKMAAQQEAIRREMQELKDGTGEMTQGEKELLNQAAREMEALEKDLVNKRITEQTLQRQQQIMSRLLESERAEMMREKDEKRESIEAKSYKPGNPLSDFQYKSMKRSGETDIKLVLPPFNSFYQSKINYYTTKIRNDHE